MPTALCWFAIGIQSMQQCRLRLSAWCVRVAHTWQNARGQGAHNGATMAQIFETSKVPIRKARPRIDKQSVIWAILLALAIWPSSGASRWRAFRHTDKQNRCELKWLPLQPKLSLFSTRNAHRY
jgi:hypothetical protein